MLFRAAPSALALVLCWLAAWRLTAMLCYEAGPFDLLSWIRVALTRLGAERLVTCFHCLGVWVSAAVVLIVFEPHLQSLLLILATAGAASITERALRPEASNV